MCGITGFAWAGREAAPPASAGAQSAAAILARMTAALTHRGPDASGERCFGHVALGHRRLSILDLSGGAQPMELPEHGLTVVFNGELYNYQELNAELAGLGFAARTRSDTETLLLAYAAWGTECLAKFNGMFSFVLYDARRQMLFGARDRMAKKPFYYVWRGPFFAFASEPKALLQHPEVKRELDPEAALRYLLYEYVPAPYAIFKGMRKLEGGQSLLFNLASGELRVQSYWTPRTEPPTPEDEARDEGHWVARIRSELDAAVRRRLISDVPLGVFLSGGVDSSAVTAAMVGIQGRQKVKTFALAFSDPRFDESAHARRLAEFLGTEHYEERLDPRASLDIFPTVSAFLDEPFADPSILPCYLLSRFARRHVTVALGGDGGDEMFAGYDTFKALPALRAYNACVPGWVDRNAIRPVVRRWPASTGNFSWDFVAKRFLRGAKAPPSQRLWRWLGAFAPEELAPLLTTEARAQVDLTHAYREVEELHARLRACDPIQRDGVLFARTYLEEVLVKVDRATMACSLEARSPLLDRDFVALCDSIPSRWKVRHGKLKWIFKQALRGRVPDELLARPKKGFGIPVAAWFREGLRELLLDTLHARRLREGGWFKPAAVERLLQEHLSGRQDHRKPLWTLLMFELWREKWLRA